MLTSFLREIISRKLGQASDVALFLSIQNDPRLVAFILSKFDDDLARECLEILSNFKDSQFIERVQEADSNIDLDKEPEYKQITFKTVQLAEIQRQVSANEIWNDFYRIS